MKRNHPIMRTCVIICVVCNLPPLLYRMYIELSDGVNSLFDYVFIIGLTTMLHIIIVGILRKGN